MKVVNFSLVLVMGSLGLASLGVATDRVGLALLVATVCCVGVLMTLIGYRVHITGIERFAQAHGLELNRNGRDDGGERLFRPISPLD